MAIKRKQRPARVEQEGAGSSVKARNGEDRDRESLEKDLGKEMDEWFRSGRGDVSHHWSRACPLVMPHSSPFVAC